MAKTIQHTLFFNHPPQLVWDYLTKSELIEQWLMKNDFRPEIGHEFTFRTRAMPNFDFDGNIFCRVLELVPLKKLSYSWKGGPGNGEITMDSIVVWTLTEKENGTDLHLQHSGFKDMGNNGILPLMDEGWFRNMKKIAELINTENRVHS